MRDFNLRVDRSHQGTANRFAKTCTMLAPIACIVPVHAGRNHSARHPQNVPPARKPHQRCQLAIRRAMAVVEFPASMESARPSRTSTRSRTAPALAGYSLSVQTSLLFEEGRMKIEFGIEMGAGARTTATGFGQCRHAVSVSILWRWPILVECELPQSVGDREAHGHRTRRLAVRSASSTGRTTTRRGPEVGNPRRPAAERIERTDIRHIGTMCDHHRSHPGARRHGPATAIDANAGLDSPRTQAAHRRTISAPLLMTPQTERHHERFHPAARNRFRRLLLF